MKFAAATIASLCSGGTCASIPRQAVRWNIVDFSASKIHLSSTVNYAFGIALGDDKTVSCSAVGDTGFSGATYLGFIYDGACADDDSWSWTFSNGYNNGTASPAYFTLTQGSLTAHHNISADEITVGLNTEPNPFDNDVYYSGPKDFFVSNLD